MSMLNGLTGSLNITEVTQALTTLGIEKQVILSLGLVFVIAAVAFKLGAVPFHMWIPDVYEGSPLSVTLVIASATKLAAFALVVRLLIDAMPAVIAQWQHVLMVIAIASMALGNLVAIVQTNIRRMLAYSSIAHIGYMTLGLVSGVSIGFGASLFYIIVYAIMALGAFGILVLLSQAGHDVQTVDDLRGLNAKNPWLAFLMLLVMFSMAGVPPSAGFFAKIAVLESLVRVHLVWLAALALIFAIVGAYYYLRVVKVMYFDAPETTTPITIEGYGQQLGISVNCLLVLILGILPVGLFQICQLAFAGN
jgi:NADH-quinone oxidoreductase subunit N